MGAFIPKSGGSKPLGAPLGGPPPSGEAPLTPKPAARLEPSLAPTGARIHGARSVALGQATAAAAGDALPSEFPLHDLSKLETHGRAASGFRLDGGALRLMWLAARRVREPSRGDGYELSFFAQGGTINTLEARLKAQGAKSGTLSFSARELDAEAPAAKARLVSSGPAWSPSQGSAVKLEQPGKFEIELVPGEPEALRGAVRIRVFGGDEAATKNLQQLVNQLGLQKLFAPPKPADLERFKLFRFLWHFAPQALEPLKHRSPARIDEQQLEEALAAQSVPENDPALLAIDAADFDEPTLARYLRHLRTFADEAPKAFLGWAGGAKSSSRGLLPAPGAVDPSAGLRSAMKAAGLDLEAPRTAGALASEVPPAVARRLLDFGVLLSRSSAAASKLCAAEIDDLGLDRLRAAAQSAGFDPADARLQDLRFEEVYPGYFTVVDPSLPDRLAETGARYLYSTAETAERVMDLLLEGQKASATRFGEGRLVQGKSSSADFSTGGAFSVFTRLVTESAIQKSSSFMNWGGSRPFKVVLSRDVLARLDWYGYNGDNYGRSTNLTAAHHGEALVKTIQESYSGSNELMFPVGNAPAFFDFVVCETDAQRKKLLDLLAGRGIQSFNGKPIEQFVRVEKTFFEHPRDQTLENAVRGALAKLALTEERAAAEAQLRALAEPKLNDWAQAAAAEALEKEAPSLVSAAAASAARSSAHAGAAKAAAQLEGKLAVEALAPAVSSASQAAAQAALDEVLPSLEEQIPRGPLDKAIRSATKTTAEKAAEVAAAELVSARLPGLLALAPADLGPEERRAWLKTELGKLSRAEAIESVRTVIVSAAEPLARETADSSIRHHLAKTATKSARAAAETHALKSARAAAQAHGSLEALRQGIVDSIRPQVVAAAEKALQSSIKNNLGAKLGTAARERVKKLVETEAQALLPALEAAVSKAAKGAALAAAESFAQSTGAALTDLMRAEAQGLAEARVTERAKALSAEQIARVAQQLPKTPVNTAVTSVLQAALPKLAGGAAQTAAEDVLNGAAEEAAERLLKQKFGPLAQEAVASALALAQAEAAKSWAPVLAAEVLAKTAPAMAEYYVERAWAARVKAALASA